MGRKPDTPGPLRISLRPAIETWANAGIFSWSNFDQRLSGIKGYGTSDVLCLITYASKTNDSCDTAGGLFRIGSNRILRREVFFFHKNITFF